jgi:FAD/FMN-containing dehydrogenase
MVQSAGGFPDDTILAATAAQEQELRRLRHALPATMNERGFAARRDGGLKVGTDWAVPLDRIDAMMEAATRIAEGEFGGYFIRYGHIGNGHPHFNMLAPDPESLARARRAAHLMCLKAVELGGTVTAEHGVGKLKREYLPHQYPAWVIDAMRAVKRTLDPKEILAPGNIFAP